MQNLFKKIDDGVKAVFETERYKECLRYMSKFTNYSAGNCILIMLQKPDASLVAAFGKWKELGRTINKGEKGIALLAPMSFKSKELKEQPVTDSSGNQVYNADGSEKKEKVEVEETSIGFEKVYVFDVSQTSGEPILEYVHALNIRCRKKIAYQLSSCSLFFCFIFSSSAHNYNLRSSVSSIIHYFRGLHKF